ncbi:ABC transporter permease [Jeotgalibacillus aurantiacus]|uniref:ABC transporter permease n=1 Tax=Jeotgalibacillus aurantiacus TaxID=2763266 RepID=UPI001D0BDC3E|nr:FtsX-like permease family protein [Jeotgalibacillus aurantiacus]
MKLKDQFRFIRQNMKKNRMRVSMTILATAMGCAFLIVLASVAFGLHSTIIKENLESPAVTQIEVYGMNDGEGNFGPLNDENIDSIEELNGVKAVTRQRDLSIFTYSIEEYTQSASTVQSHFPSMTEAGIEISEGSYPQNKDEVMVGYHFALNFTDPDAEEIEYNEFGVPLEEYRYSENLVGKTIDMEIKTVVNGEETIETMPVTVSGIFEAPAREWSQDHNVYITDEKYNELAAIAGLTGEFGEIETTDHYQYATVYANTLEDVKPVVADLENEGYAVYSIVSEMSQINMLFNIAKAGLIFIGTIAILIASIGIFNTMTMAVTERAPDIGIMKAIGASPKVIKRIFLLESSYIGLMGAVIGIIAAYVISISVNLGLPLILQQVFPDEQLPEGFTFSSIPPSLILIAVAICLAVTVMSGMRPAKRATEVDVLKAMRREL